MGIYKEPLAVNVKYELHNDFRSLVTQNSDCKVVKVIEVLCCKMLQYWIECPDDKIEIIKRYGFMTWIKNPKFQECYLETKAFKEIAKNYTEKDAKN